MDRKWKLQVWRLLLLTSLVHLCLILVGFLLSSDLPTLLEIYQSSGEEANSCYLLSASVPVPQCGADVVAGGLWAFVYGYWQNLILLPGRAMVGLTLIFSGTLTNAGNGEIFKTCLIVFGFLLASLAFIAPFFLVLWVLVRAVLKQMHRLSRSLAGKKQESK